MIAEEGQHAEQLASSTAWSARHFSRETREDRTRIDKGCGASGGNRRQCLPSRRIHRRNYTGRMKSGSLVFALVLAAAAILAAQSSQPTFRADVTLVTTDVIPRDRNGRFVADLAKENFTLLEDGQPQTISSFFLVHGGRTFNLFESGAPSASANDGIVLPPSRPRANDSAGRVVLIFVADLHFEPEMSPNVRKVFQTLVETLVHEGDLVAVISSGPSYIEVGPTYDRKMVMGAVGKIRGSGLLASEIFKMLETSQGPGDIRARAQQAFYAAYAILGELEHVSNKRKAVVYISPGYDFDPFAEG